MNALKNIDLENSRDFESDLYPSLIKSENLGNIKTKNFWFSIDTQKDINLINQEDSPYGQKLNKVKRNILNFFKSHKGGL